MEAEDLLDNLGITRVYYGFYILADIIKAAIEDEEILFQFGALYAAEAIKYDKTEAAVEKACRTAVSRAWKKSRAKLEKLARYDLTCCPSVSEFCSIIVVYFLRRKKALEAHNSPS